MAMPGLVQAVASEQGYLIDGGVVNPLPYNHLRGLADMIVETDRLIAAGHLWTGAAYAVASIVLGVLAATIGIVLARSLPRWPPLRTTR